MKKKLIPSALLAVAGLTLAACGGTGGAWSWENASSDGVLNYALLIGQIDHNDSAARTAGIRDALGTRGEKLTNANAEEPVQGKLTLGGKEYTVNEVEHAEQKSTSGATWDQQTATTTTETWLNNHTDIDFFVSNNDGMAEGALGATNWVEGMPIFGYDANASTLQLIKSGQVMGTVDQNAPAQAAAIYMVARNAADGATGDEVRNWGFSEAHPNGYGQLETVAAYDIEDHSLLVDNIAVTADNVDDFITDDPTSRAEPVTKGTSETINVWHSFYSASDTFLNSTMKPLFNHYQDLFNLEVTQVSGDGNDDTTNLNALDSATDVDAYVINMVKTTSTGLYLDKIAEKVGATEANPTNIPVVFWNRQGTLEDGTVDSASMADARFNHIYYVGFDAIQGGQLQGEMIVDYFEGLAA